MTSRDLVIICALIALTGCSTGERSFNSGEPFPLDVQSSNSAAVEQGGAYTIGPSDKLNITVFQVPELSSGEIVVDPSGTMQLPLLGSIKAAGYTSDELARIIEAALSERYLREPHVTVRVAEAVSQKVTVDGAVTKPGVYSMSGRTTLMQAVAMAEGPTRVAALDRVAVFRTVEGRRTVAVFDLAAIRAGQQPDPLVIGEDIVVVDTSTLSVVLREAIQALPGLAVFGYF